MDELDGPDDRVMEGLPDGAVFVEIDLPRALIGSLQPVEGDPFVQDGLQLNVTGFGGTMTFLDAALVPVVVEPQGLVTFSVHVPLEGSDEAAASRAGFEGLVEKGVEVRVYVRRNLASLTRPYDVLSFTHEYGSFEVAIGG